jgi:dCTP deaminase
MILSGPEILKQVELGNIRIDPFNAKRVNPASFDLTLGDQVAVYSNVVDFLQGEIPSFGHNLVPKRDGILDTAKNEGVLRYKILPEGWLLKPGIGYLMHTAETVWTKSYVPVLDGKSSIGRMFIKVHETAGYGDPNFDGQYTLEVTAVHPVIVYPGMRIAQIRFHAMEGELALYDGNYKNENAKGPVPSRVWAQIKNEGLGKKD